MDWSVSSIILCCEVFQTSATNSSFNSFFRSHWNESFLSQTGMRPQVFSVYQCSSSKACQKYLLLWGSEFSDCFFFFFFPQVILASGVFLGVLRFNEIDKIRLIYFIILHPSFICWSDYNILVFLGQPPVFRSNRPYLPTLIYLAHG